MCARLVETMKQKEQMTARKFIIKTMKAEVLGRTRMAKKLGVCRAIFIKFMDGANSDTVMDAINYTYDKDYPVGNCVKTWKPPTWVYSVPAHLRNIVEQEVYVNPELAVEMAKAETLKEAIAIRSAYYSRFAERAVLDYLVPQTMQKKYRNY